MAEGVPPGDNGTEYLAPADEWYPLMLVWQRLGMFRWIFFAVLHVTVQVLFVSLCLRREKGPGGGKVSCYHVV